MHAFGYDILLPEMFSARAIRHPVICERPLRVLRLPVGKIDQASIDPRSHAGQERMHPHVVLVDNLKGGVAVREDDVEALCKIVNLSGYRVTGNAQMQISIELEILFQVEPHQRLAGVASMQQLVKEPPDLVCIHRTV